MTKEDFTKILKEYKYPDDLIEDLWNSRKDRVLTEEKVRRTCEFMKPLAALFAFTEKE